MNLTDIKNRPITPTISLFAKKVVAKHDGWSIDLFDNDDITKNNTVFGLDISQDPQHIDEITFKCVSNIQPHKGVEYSLIYRPKHNGLMLIYQSCQDDLLNLFGIANRQYHMLNNRTINPHRKAWAEHAKNVLLDELAKQDLNKLFDVNGDLSHRCMTLSPALVLDIKGGA